MVNRIKLRSLVRVIVVSVVTTMPVVTQKIIELMGFRVIDNWLKVSAGTVFPIRFWSIKKQDEVTIDVTLISDDHDRDKGCNGGTNVQTKQLERVNSSV